MNSSSNTNEEHAYLLARSGLESYLKYVRDYAVDAHLLDQRDLVDSWKRAADRMDQLREVEADRADGVSVEPLPAAWRTKETKLRQDPVFQRAFADSEVKIGIIDLDRVVVSQKLVSLAHTKRIQDKLATKITVSETANALFECCLPTIRQLPLPRVSRISDDEFSFVSASNDLRFLEAVLIKPDQLVGYQATGPVAAVVALVVGYGSNYLHVLSVGGRLILNNGHHRACALWQAGHRRVPCVVQEITHSDELDLHAPGAVSRNPAFYLTEPRPPLVGDYFDPVLSKQVCLALTSKEIRLGYSVDEKDIP